jgi:hypothetical protein
VAEIKAYAEKRVSEIKAAMVPLQNALSSSAPVDYALLPEDQESEAYFI